MITREQIDEIQAESREKGISIKKLLDERGIPAHQYFWWKKKYARETIPEGFVPVAGGMLPAVMAAASKPIEPCAICRYWTLSFPILK